MTVTHVEVVPLYDIGPMRKGNSYSATITPDGKVELGTWGIFHHSHFEQNDRITAYRNQPASQTRHQIKPAAPVGPVATKASNPKDLIGDTKIPLWLLSPIAKMHWALAQFSGLVKYGAWNWRVAGVRSSVYLSAMQRHIDAYTSGEELDPVDGTHHLGNVMACCAIILDAQAAGKLTDDRPPSVAFRDAYDAAMKNMTALKAQYADKHPTHYTELNKADNVPE